MTDQYLDTEYDAVYLLHNVYLCGARDMTKLIKLCEKIQPKLCVCCARELRTDVLTCLKNKTDKLAIWPLIDSPRQQLAPSLFSLVDLILNTQKEGPIVVFCHMGVSRSVALCMAVMCNKFNIKPNKALALIRAKRPIVNPNEGFVKELNIIYK